MRYVLRIGLAALHREKSPLDFDEKIRTISAILRLDEETAVLLLEQVFKFRFVPAKEVIARQGDRSGNCWLVVDGAVRIHSLSIDGQRQQLAQHGEGELFGSYPGPNFLRGEIVAWDDTRLLQAEAQQLAAFAAEHVQIASGLAILLAHQLDRALDRMVARTTYSAAGRVYAMLLELADKDSRIVPPPQVTSLALSANTTRESASRALAVLVRRGIITRDDEALVIQAPRMLQELIF